MDIKSKFKPEVKKIINNVNFEIEIVNSTIYVFCSELDSLKIWKKYNFTKHNDNTYQGYSNNLKSFYFSLTL